MINDILCVILGGGRGTRLYPLTRDRAKPAVPLFGKYRLVDIPISNCLNSGLRQINILTQFNSESLNKHITRTYKFDQFSQGFIEIIAADQTMDNTDWFQGPADAVRKSLKHFSGHKIKYVCILSGDQLYKMDLKKFLDYHVSKNSEITVACNVISPDQISSFGIMGINSESRLTAFIEKPAKKEVVAGLSVNRAGEEKFLCSMGIYLFNVDVLSEVLSKSKKADFGKEIIPEFMSERRIYAYEFSGYWRDIGTISSFYAENLALTRECPPLDLFDEAWPIYTRSRSLPPARHNYSTIERSIVADGSSIDASVIRGSVIGLRSNIGKNAIIEDSILMGADYYETQEEKKENSLRGNVNMGIGEDCHIRGAILDKNVRIGRGVKILNQKGVKEFQGPDYLIKDGIVVVYKNATLAPGTII